MGSYFDQREVFPVIAEIIENHSAQSNNYLTHEQIVSSLLVHPEGSRLVNWARERAKFERDRRSKDWNSEQWADNMVAWFSQRITVAESPWRRSFEREKIGGKWAYRVSPNTG